MTRDEHVARAMLLGRVYHKEIGAYEYPWRQGTHRAEDSIDAETMEPLTNNEWWIRFITSNNEKRRLEAERQEMFGDLEDE